MSTSSPAPTAAPAQRARIAVMHASGRTGQRLARKLLGAGHTVRALGRSAVRLGTLVDHGAQACIGDPRDTHHLARAFEGMDVVYALMPYDLTQPGHIAHQRELGQAMADAVRAARVPRVVLLSSLGAELSQGTGMILSLHEQEQRLADIPCLHATFLRAGDFMENRLGSLASMLEHRVWSDVVSVDRPVPMVATADIADAAFEVVRAADWTGLNVREVLGPCDISYGEVTDVLTDRLGLPDLRYEPCSAQALRDMLMGAGLPPDTAELTAEISQAIEDGRIRSRQGRTDGNTTPTRFADFAQGLVLPAMAT